MSKFRSAAGIATGDREPTLPLRRVPATGKIVGVVTTYDVREVWTHFFRGHTVGCSRPACPGCRAGAAMRYEGYVGFYSAATRKHVILGLTVGAVRQIADQCGRLDQIRGLTIAAQRASKKINARVVIETGLICPDMSALPPAFNVLDHLTRIWGVEAQEDIAAAESIAMPLFLQEPQQKAKDQVIQEHDHWRLVEGLDPGELDGQLHFPETE